MYICVSVCVCVCVSVVVRRFSEAVEFNTFICPHLNTCLFFYSEFFLPTLHNPVGYEHENETCRVEFQNGNYYNRLLQ